MMRGPRWPRVGDLIIVSETFDVNNGPQHSVGVVNTVTIDNWNTPADVFMTWQSDKPVSYDPKYGYSAVNIHNLRHKYRIFRDGVEVQWS